METKECPRTAEYLSSMKLCGTAFFGVAPGLQKLPLESNTGGITNYDVWLWSTPGANPSMVVVYVQQPQKCIPRKSPTVVVNQLSKGKITDINITLLPDVEKCMQSNSATGRKK